MALPHPKPLSMQGDVLKNWQTFRQQFEIYMKATESDSKPMAVQVAIFLNTIGEEGLEAYNKLDLADESDDLEMIKAKLEEHFTPRKNTVWNRLMLYRRMRRENETFAAFYESISSMIKCCDYKDHEELILRDKIVAAINCHLLQQKMVQNPDLTLDEAVKMCNAAESVLVQQDAARKNFQSPRMDQNQSNLANQMKMMHMT